jgi:hypothetical protein
MKTKYLPRIVERVLYVNLKKESWIKTRPQELLNF